jgi:uncharacterized protein (TIGR03086 family)
MTQATADEQRSTPSPLDDLDRAVAAADQVVAGIRDDLWTAPTVNTDWDVRATLNHLAVGNLRFVCFLQREHGIDPDIDYLGDDPLEGFRASARALRAAFDRPGVMEDTFNSPLGPVPGARMVHMRVAEHLVHGWDLAQATVQSTAGFPADLAAASLAQWKQVLGDRPRDGIPFADPKLAEADAPAIDRLAAYLGRPVGA